MHFNSISNLNSQINIFNYLGNSLPSSLHKKIGAIALIIFSAVAAYYLFYCCCFKGKSADDFDNKEELDKTDKVVKEKIPSPLLSPKAQEISGAPKNWEDFVLIYAKNRSHNSQEVEIDGIGTFPTKIIDILLANRNNLIWDELKLTYSVQFKDGISGLLSGWVTAALCCDSPVLQQQIASGKKGPLLIHLTKEEFEKIFMLLYLNPRGGDENLLLFALEYGSRLGISSCDKQSHLFSQSKDYTLAKHQAAVNIYTNVKNSHLENLKQTTENYFRQVLESTDSFIITFYQSAKNDHDIVNFLWDWSIERCVSDHPSATKIVANWKMIFANLDMNADDRISFLELFFEKVNNHPERAKLAELFHPIFTQLFEHQIETLVVLILNQAKKPLELLEFLLVFLFPSSTSPDKEKQILILEKAILLIDQDASRRPST